MTLSSVAGAFTLIGIKLMNHSSQVQVLVDFETNGNLSHLNQISLKQKNPVDWSELVNSNFLLIIWQTQGEWRHWLNPCQQMHFVKQITQTNLSNF